MTETSGIPSWAVVGAKVVCINDRCGPTLKPPTPVVRGKVYTIERVFADCGEQIFVDLVEGGAGWRLARFRPVVSTAQERDVALFRSLLKSAGVDA